jgi:hypothetical protein
MARLLSARKTHEWERRLRRFRKSRQSVAAFCREEGVSPPSFYLWKRRLSQASKTVSSAVEPPAGFRPVRLVSAVVSAAGIDVQLPGGTQLVVPLSDAQSLQLVIETLARVDADRVREARPC